jgi:hypothetical protein
MLKRHLATEHGLTPEAYREPWGLGRDYPMVAPDYAEVRSGLARQIGLGHRHGMRAATAEEGAPAPEPDEAPDVPGRAEPQGGIASMEPAAPAARGAVASVVRNRRARRPLKDRARTRHLRREATGGAGRRMPTQGSICPVCQDQRY